MEKAKCIQADYSSKIKELSLKLAKKRKTKVLVLFFGGQAIVKPTVNAVYGKLKKEYKGTKRLDVIIDSGGGDIDAAYMLAKVLRRYASEKLTFIVPRWAKSAATLLACSGDEIIMGPISELGPLDPQIMDGNTGNSGPISPLSIKSTLGLIREEAENGSKELAQMMAQKLLPLTLGTYLKSLDISKVYQKELLQTRMFKNLKDSNSKASSVAEKFVTGYPHHGYCIDVDESKKLGLNVVEANAKEWDIIWAIYEQYTLEREQIEKDRIKKLKDEILDRLTEKNKK